MYPKFLFFLLPAALFVTAAFILFAWERLEKKENRRAPGNGSPEGAFRSFYHALWLLLLWSGLALSLPLWVSYKEKILRSGIEERWFVVAKVLAFPVIILVLLWYGGRQGYLKWIENLEWPDKENK